MARILVAFFWQIFCRWLRFTDQTSSSSSQNQLAPIPVDFCSREGLPGDVIWQILCLLPVKSLLRFRCVSKSWRSLIDSPDFIIGHLKHSISTSSGLSVICRSGKGYDYSCKELYSIKLDTNTVIQLNSPVENLRLVASCNGLLALSTSRSYVVLWNPATRVYCQISIPSTKHVYPYFIGGFGYDSVKDDYKLVIMFEFWRPDDDLLLDIEYSDGTEAYVYSLKDNVWKMIQDIPIGFIRECKIKSVLVNNALHTRADHHVLSDSFSVVVAFDLEAEEFRNVPQPDHGAEGDSFKVDVVGGCLGLICYFDDHVDVWVMKEYGVKESWIKQFSVTCPSRYYAAPIGYTKHGKVILEREKILFYDLSSKTLESVRISDEHICFNGKHCVESLVPLIRSCRVGGQDKKKMLIIEGNDHYVRAENRRMGLLSPGSFHVFGGIGIGSISMVLVISWLILFYSRQIDVTNFI